jgi:hypothetical protein
MRRASATTAADAALDSAALEAPVPVESEAVRWLSRSGTLTGARPKKEKRLMRSAWMARARAAAADMAAEVGEAASAASGPSAVAAAGGALAVAGREMVCVGFMLVCGRAMFRVMTVATCCSSGDKAACVAK